MKNIIRFLKLSATAGILTAMLAGCASSDERRTAGEYLDDQTINARVKTSLLGDDVIRGRSISTTTFEGVVQLSGFVDNQTEQQRAEELASNVDGVRDVINNIEIKPDDVQFGAPGERDMEEETEELEEEIETQDVPENRNAPRPNWDQQPRSIPPASEPMY